MSGVLLIVLHGTPGGDRTTIYGSQLCHRPCMIHGSFINKRQMYVSEL